MGRGSGGLRLGGPALGPAARTIRPDQVAAYTEHSKVKQILHHRTTEAGKASILAAGITLSEAQTGLYGKGFYTTVGKAEAIWGKAEVRVAVDARKVLSLTAGAIRKRISDFRTAHPGPDLSGRFSQYLRGQGYDAVRVRFRPRKTEYQGVPAGQSREWIVILKPSAARLIQ